MLGKVWNIFLKTLCHYRRRGFFFGSSAVDPNRNPSEVDFPKWKGQGWKTVCLQTLRFQFDTKIALPISMGQCAQFLKLKRSLNDYNIESGYCWTDSKTRARPLRSWRSGETLNDESHVSHGAHKSSQISTISIFSVFSSILQSSSASRRCIPHHDITPV